MNNKNSMSLLEKGKEALYNNEEQLALEYFEQAIQQERSPEICSFYAYFLAKHRKKYNDAISLAKEAIECEPSNPQFYLNYGRILCMTGDKDQAAATFREGLEYGMHFDFIRELERGGMAEKIKPSLFKKLRRNNLLNSVARLLLTKLNLR